ncbi:hypothetical protein WMY93_017766 [Mugilogobius chulae]|uniref:Tyr recombinase domain-containing protein n=1 Tax=Mugilogobius chulae TaxID=88201 RepID=A0AAW0NTI7_9GOBI
MFRLLVPTGSSYALPFRAGISNSGCFLWSVPLPRVFTRVVAAALSPLQAQGLKVLPYLDDWLICASTRDQALRDTEVVLGHLRQLAPPPWLPALATAGQRYSGTAPQISKRQDVAFHAVPPTAGQVGSGFKRGPIGSSFSAPNADVAEQPTLGSMSAVTQTQDGTGVAAVPYFSVSMEEQAMDCSRGSSRLPPVPQRGGVHRRIHHRVGSDVARPGGTGNVVATFAQSTHQCPGAVGCSPSTASFSAESTRKARVGPIGQHVRCVPPQPHGRNQVSETEQRGTTDSDVGVSEICQPESRLSSREAEQCGGFSFSPDIETWRMDASSGGCGEHLAGVRQGERGPLCFQRGTPLSSMVLPERPVQSIGLGCNGARLASRSSVCFSPILPDIAHSDEGSSEGPQATPGSPLLAGQDMVSAAAQALLQLADAPSAESGSSVSNGGTDAAPQSRSPPALGLAVTGPGIGVSDFNGDVGHTISNARAPSTRLQYANRWRLFSEWCHEKGQDPSCCPVSFILSFLQELLNQGRSPSTLKVYVAAISCSHVGLDGVSVGRNRSVALFLKGARRLHPPRRRVASTWDLAVVLNALQSPPFEPLSAVDLKWISMKTAFLLAMVSAKRVGELQALSVHESCCQWKADGSGVTLWPDPSFVPKVPSSTAGTQPLRLARFDTEASSAQLCPVRALEEYIKVTASIRRSDRLFICFAGPRKGQALSKQRLAHWVVDVISKAYELCGQSLPAGVRCHSTRAVSTSWAAMAGVPLEVICEAASWTSPNTFARFYRVNMASAHPLDGVLRHHRSSSC